MTTIPSATTPTSSFTAEYDAWNRMTKASSVTYRYDGLRRRVIRDDGTTTRHYYFSDKWQQLEERVGTSASADLQYVWGMRHVDELVCREDPTNGRLFVMQDANFNVTAICNTSGTVQERFQYDPYGNRTIMSASWTTQSSSVAWVTGFQGLPLDGGMGVYWVRNRVYSPLVGVWVQRDPLGYLDGPSLYEFVSSNPIIGLDPIGTSWWCNAKCIAAVTVAAAALTLCFAALASCVATGGAACPVALGACCGAIGALGAAVRICSSCTTAGGDPRFNDVLAVLGLVCAVASVFTGWKKLLPFLRSGAAPAASSVLTLEGGSSATGVTACFGQSTF